MKDKSLLVGRKRSYKYLDFLVLLSVAMMILTNTTAGKITQFWIFTFSVSVFYYPLTYLLGDLLTEVYGYRHARRAMWILIYAQILTAVIYTFVVFLPSASGFKFNDAFSIVLGQAPRIVIGGLIAFFAGQFVNDFILAKMKVLTKGRYLWTRTISSTVAGQFFDTTLFYSIAISNLIPAGVLLQTILSGWFLKVMVEVVMTPVTYFAINKVKKSEHEDYFDKNTNFNPLIFNLKHQERTMRF